jgi:hypothetical protein
VEKKREGGKGCASVIGGAPQCEYQYQRSECGYTQVNINVLKSWLGGKNEFIFHVILRTQVTTVSTDF